MNICAVDGTAAMNISISDDQLAELQIKFNVSFPSDYVSLLKWRNGFSLNNGLFIYSSDELVERNAAFEVDRYASGYLAIGDDSGGRSIMIPLIGEGVYVVDQGSMDPDDFEKISTSLANWVAKGCALGETGPDRSLAHR
ncbi:SMI1/KNR4 family protein [Pseudomonas sp. RGM2987]|uniref:SMI1/KNR4 family protein n=1 Tax=Pseudomonas sp. RGM2987 TaxID=2930090 RepID=UPI001FD68B72|nr:SMI1/KNR4 family protein [Pseudomonas sp. RGM2987]MCJ8207431.1 SMI1/KNR4 family protein [Pseudomonas sp. RGM2987]